MGLGAIVLTSFKYIGLFAIMYILIHFSQFYRMDTC